MDGPSDQLLRRRSQFALTGLAPDVAVEPVGINLEKQVGNGAQRRGQLVAQIAGSLRSPLLLGNVGRNTKQTGDLAGGIAHRHLDGDIAATLAVDPADAVFDIAQFLAALDHPPIVVSQGGGRLGIEKSAVFLSDHFFERAAEQLAGRPVGVLVAVIASLDENIAANTIDDGLQALALFAELAGTAPYLAAQQQVPDEQQQGQAKNRKTAIDQVAADARGALGTRRTGSQNRQDKSKNARRKPSTAQTCPPHHGRSPSSSTLA